MTPCNLPLYQCHARIALLGWAITGSAKSPAATVHGSDCHRASATCTEHWRLQALSEKHIGVVAHFYMDPEVQGVLTAAHERWPHIHISDSLVMADSAVKMAEGGCTAVAVLGVDFMSENVRAILDEAGYRDVQVRHSASALQSACKLAAGSCYAHIRTSSMTAGPGPCHSLLKGKVQAAEALLHACHASYPQGHLESC